MGPLYLRRYKRAPGGGTQGKSVTLANRITIGRVLLIPVFVVLIMTYTRGEPWIRHLALVVYIIAALSDALDGFIARAYNQKTRLGAVLDPLADKLMINLGFIFIAVSDQFAVKVPGWFPVIVLMRDAIIVTGSYLINEFYGPVRVRARISGKINTVFQMSTMIAILMELRFAYALLLITVVISVVSLIDYVIAGCRQIGNEDIA